MAVSSPYGILTNPAYQQGIDDAQPAPLPTIAAAPAAPDALPTIKASPAPPTMRQAPVFQQNPMRQQREQQLESIMNTPKAKPQGFWPKAASILGDIGNAAGTVILGNDKMAGIPGTSQFKANQMNAEGRELGGLEKQDAADQTAFGENQLRNAETAKTSEETAEMPGAETSKESLEGAEAERAGRPDLAQAYANAVSAAIKGGGDPQSDPVVQHLADAITAIQKQPADATGPKTIQKEIGNAPHTFAYDSSTKDYSRDEGPTGEKPPTVRVETPGEERGAKNDLLKAYQPALDSAERMNVMTDAYEKAVKNHDQQAMLNLLANHLGMTMGLQKGARMTKDIINEAQKSTPWLQGMGAKFDKDGYLSGVTLTPNQMRQMVNLGQERYAEDAQKSRSTAKYLGAKDDGPDRVPGKATINYYLGLANGDPTKAKQLAAQDGWTVK
jgi:hypothetical protein